VIAMPRAMARLGESSSGQRWPKWVLVWRMLGALPAGLLYCWPVAPQDLPIEAGRAPFERFQDAPPQFWLRLTGTPVLWHIHDFGGQRPIMARLLPRFASGVPPQSRIPNTSEGSSRDFAGIAGNHRF